MSHQKRLAFRRDAVLSKKYDNDVEQFKQKMEKWENSPRKRLRDQRNREQCEKVFPELKRQREAKERVSRTAQRQSLAMKHRINSIMFFVSKQRQKCVS